MLALNKEGQIENILISKLKNSIRPRINENRKDSKLEDFSDFFKSGDLIWTSKEEGLKGLKSIAVHPEVQSALVSVNPSNGEVLALSLIHI